MGHIIRCLNKLPRDARANIRALLVEGVSIRAVSRLTCASKNTIVKLLEGAGEACSDYQDRIMRHLQCKRIQVDEIWAFVYGEAKNVETGNAAPEGAGDCWTWVGIDADTKLIPSFYVGNRDAVAAQHFIGDLAQRLANRVQLASDVHKQCLEAAAQSVGAHIDYAVIIKHYAAPAGAIGRYSPSKCTGVELRRVEGRPDPAHVSTGYAERANLTSQNGCAPVYAADQRFFQKGRKPFALRLDS